MLLPRLNRKTLVLGGLVLAVVALLAWVLLRRGKEGWGTRTDVNDGHAEVIRKYCASGRKVSEILNTYPDYEQYTFKAVIDACTPGADQWLTKAKNQSGSSVDCGNTNPCPNPALAITHPCTNKDNQKCCVPKDEDGDFMSVDGMQNCITTGGAIDKKIIDRAKTEVSVDDKTQCVYETRAFANNKWACRTGWVDTGVNWSTDGSVPMYIARRQCARSESCKKAAQGAEKWAKSQ